MAKTQKKRRKTPINYRVRNPLTLLIRAFRKHQARATAEAAFDHFALLANTGLCVDLVKSEGPNLTYLLPTGGSRTITRDSFLRQFRLQRGRESI